MILAKIKEWIAIVSTVIAAVAVALYVGWLKGKKAGKRKAAEVISRAKTKAAISDDVAAKLEARMKVDAQIKQANKPEKGKSVESTVDSNLGGWMRNDDKPPKPK